MTPPILDHSILCWLPLTLLYRQLSDKRESSDAFTFNPSASKVVVSAKAAQQSQEQYTRNNDTNYPEQWGVIPFRPFTIYVPTTA